jgi:hypothetical protein
MTAACMAGPSPGTTPGPPRDHPGTTPGSKRRKRAPVGSIQLQRRIAEQLSVLLQVPQVLQLPSLGLVPCLLPGGCACPPRRGAGPARPHWASQPPPRGHTPVLVPGLEWVGGYRAQARGLELRSSALPDAIPKS